MKRLLAPMVLLAGSVSAHAQSNVTVYGLLDVAVGVSKASGGTSLPGGGTNIPGESAMARMDSGVGPGGSRLGFRGQEDLGDGMKAMFVLEQGLAMDTGALQQGGLMWGRQALVGLTSAKGWTLTTGRQYTPLNLTISQSDPTYGFYWGNPTTNSGFAIYESVGATPGSGTYGATGRQDNSILLSATSGGLTGMLMYALGNENTRGTGKMINPAIAYTYGPLSLRASYAMMRQNVESITAAASPEWLRQFAVGGSYTLPSATLFAGIYGFNGPKNSANLSPVATFGASTASPFAYMWRETRSVWAGARVPLATGTVIASIMRSKYDYATGSDGTTNALTLAYEYPLSKRTLLYANVGRVSNDAFARSPLVATVVATLPRGFGSDISAAALGMRHTF